MKSEKKILKNENNVLKNESNGKKKKLIEAFVSSNKKFAEGTITVIVKRRFRHPIYGKIMNAEKKQIVDFEKKEFLEIGTKVLITSCRPLSKRKKFKIVEVCPMHERKKMEEE
jgi:small subunit ribosomal protein S17